jgi:hypothetical protein
MQHRNVFILLAGLAFVLNPGCSGDATVEPTAQSLAPACIENADDLEGEGWLCPDDLTVECEGGTADPALIYLEPSGDLPESCDEIELSLNDEGPFEVGIHEVVITAEASGVDGGTVEVMCEATLTVEDTVPPEAVDETVALWPPNHKLHTISGEDCVRDACDDNLAVTFLSASSDEPVNDKGDGNSEPDIILDCDHVQLRSERQGGGNGRIYTLGWKAVDDAGNETEGECIVTVPHDQSGREAVDDGPAYQMTLDPNECESGAGGAGGAGGAAGAGGEGGAGGAGGVAGAGGAGGVAGAGGAGGVAGAGGAGGVAGAGGAGGVAGAGGAVVE